MSVLIYDRVDRPLVVVDRVELHGIAARGAIVEASGELHVHGVVVGDVRVEAGGRAYIGGRVTGYVNNRGQVIVDGVVGAAVRTLEDGKTTLRRGARISRGGWHPRRIEEDEEEVATPVLPAPFAD